MIYPPHDRKVVESATAALQLALAAEAATRNSIAGLESNLAAAQQKHAAALDRAASGDAQAVVQLAEFERDVATVEMALRHQGEILRRQAGKIAGAQLAINLSRGLAEKPRVIAAIAEIRDAGVLARDARQALADAESRDAAARRVINEAFSHGFPVPPSMRGGASGLVGIPTATHEAALRSAWGDLADEALGAPKGAAPNREKKQTARFVFGESFTLAGARGTIEIVAGRPIILDPPEQIAIEGTGRLLPPAMSLETAT